MSGTAWLSPEWFEELRRLGADCPAQPGLSATVECELTGGASRSVRCHAVLEDGRLTGGSTGRADSPDVSLTVTWGDGIDLVKGALDPSVAFMQGRLKVGGSMKVVLALLTATDSERYRELTRSLAAVTEF